MSGLYLVAFLALAAAFIIRILSAVKSAHRRPAWLACGIGALAILTLGPIVPVDTIDAALGGTNIIYLVQCWLALIAFWLVTEAARSIADRDATVRHPWIIAAYCGLIAIPFFFITDRAPTAPYFIHDHVEQLAAVMCASVYMIGVAFLTVRLLVHVRTKRSIGYWLFRAGGALVIGGIVTEIIGLLAGFLGAPNHVRDALWSVFDPTFYPGILLIVSGIFSFWIARRLRTARTRRRIRRLTEILTQRGIAVPRSDPEDHAYTVYALLIRITDAEVLGHMHLTDEERAGVEESERWVERILPQLVEVGT